MSAESTPQRDARQMVRDSRLTVIKIGTAVLRGGSGQIDAAYIEAIAKILAQHQRQGRAAMVVSSGAVGAGLGALRMETRPHDLTLLQAAAAAGQSVVMSIWREALEGEGLCAAQLLLTRSDLDSRERFLNIRNCAHALLERGVVPIVNENDTVATEEISLGDNDVLAAKLAVCVSAEALVMLTSEDGVRDETGDVVAYAQEASQLRRFVREGHTDEGRGGMATKLEAARIAQLAGMACVIGAGRPPGALSKILAGDEEGTLICGPGGVSHRGRRQWIALTATPVGIVEIDDGAARALSTRNASLLAKGVIGCQGRFEVGDVVAVRDAKGREIGRGLSNLASEEVHRVKGRESSEFGAILGRQAHEEVIHRDNLTLATSEVDS